MKNKLLKIILSILIITSCTLNNKQEDDINNNSNEDTLIKFKYEFNEHVIAQEYIDIYGQDIKEEFFNFCDSLLSINKSFKCKSKERLYELLSISNSCFPIASYLINKDKTYVENGICYLTYNYDDNEVNKIISSFKTKITNTINNAIKYEAPYYIKAMELYTTLSNKNTYDYSYTLEDSLKLNPYRAIMQDIGICQELADEYIYYLLQVGINAITCSALNSDNSEAHEWVLIKLNHNYYHVDPTYAIEYPNSLYFFCIDDIQRQYYGDFPIDNFTYASSDKLNYETFQANDRTFEKYWLAQEYEIDYINKSITIKEINTNKEYTYPFDE